MNDVIIRNARIVDGANTPWFRGGVAIRDGFITKVGSMEGEKARETVDAQGMYLAPGFIDIHTHTDATLLKYPLNESRILQGVTTEIGGACGLSVAPVNPQKKDQLAAYLSNYLGEISYDWHSMADFLALAEAAHASTNFGMVVGHGSVRIAAMGFDDRQPTPAELEKMCDYVSNAMREGAFGISSGLVYAPGVFSDIAEMAAVVAAVRPFGGFYETHLRDENDKGLLLEAMHEALKVCRLSGVPLQFSHHKVAGVGGWQVMCKASCALIERARAQGLDVTADQYTYSAACTGILLFMPGWTLEGGVNELMKRLRNPQTRARIAAEIQQSCSETWDRLVVASLKSAENAWMAGKSIAAIAAKRGCAPVDAMLDIVIEENGACTIIELSMCEEDVEFIMRQRFTMIGSDGLAAMINSDGIPLRHPRIFGAFARMLGHYCRDRALFPVETAISKMTGMPAARAGLCDRGLIKQGMRADLVLFDLAAIKDKATFENPQQGAEGILRVYVNGVLTAQNGAHTGARAGMVLRRR